MMWRPTPWCNMNKLSGIDLVYYGNHGNWNMILWWRREPILPDPAQPCRSADMRVDEQGQLVVQTAHGAVRWNKPLIYQKVDGMRRAVKGKYVLRRGQR